MTEKKKPLPPKWDAPFPETTAAVISHISSAAKKTSEAAKPVTEPVGSAIGRVFGAWLDSSSAGLPGFKVDSVSDPIRPREGPNYFDIRANERTAEKEAERREKRDEELRNELVMSTYTDDVSPAGRNTIRDIVAGIVSRATGFDKDHNEIGLFTPRTRSRRAQTLQLDDALQGRSPHETLVASGSSFLAPASDLEQNRAVRDAVTVFALQHPPSHILKRRRLR